MSDLIARGLINDAKPFDKDDMAGDADNFGVAGQWRRRASEFMEDANDWCDPVTFPDIDS